MIWTNEKPTVRGWYWYRTGPGDTGDWSHQDETIIFVERWAGELAVSMAGSAVSYKLEDAHGVFAGPIERPRGHLPV